MICGSIVNLSSFKDIRTISQNPNTTISIATDATNPANRYIFKTFNFNCNNGHQQKIFAEVFSDVSILTLSNSSIPANNYAISQNQSIFSFFNATHYYESYSSLDFSGRLKPTFCSICISEITLDKILRRQVQISSSWTLEDTLNCLFSVAISMKRLHDSLIIHGNLCPSNILVDKVKQCYISDFGLYRIKELYYKPPFINIQYSAQEIDPLHPTKASDVFSYGTIMCRLLQEYFLQSKFSLVQLIMEDRFDYKILPPFLADIISKCLEKNPAKRCNFDFIIQTFQAKSFVIKHINISDYFYKFKHKFYIEKLANANDPLCLNILGDLLSNPAKAFEIKDRNPESLQHLKKRSDGDLSHGLYLKYDRQVDEQMSAECYKRSASFGSSEAQANYGVCLLSGTGIPIDMLKGLSNIEKSAKQGCVKGLYALGICNMKGIGVNKVDFVNAEKYLRAAADSSDINVNNVNNSIICKARYNLGLIMEMQNRDFEAAKCFKLAAYMALESKTNSCSPTSFACPEALYAYAQYLKNGVGVSTDLSAACYFFKMAHFQGYRPGSFQYAKMVLDNEANSNIGLLNEESNKFAKNEASLIMKSLADMNYKKAVEYLNRNGQSHIISRESSSDKDRNREKSRDSERDREKDRNRDRDKNREKDKGNHSDRDKTSSKISNETSKSKQKKSLSSEKLQEKFDKHFKGLIEKGSSHFFDYEKDFAESKNSNIINQLALLYQEGKYVDQNMDKACYYFKLAADLGNADAQASYGSLLLEGKIGPDYKKDFEGAMRMFQKSAMQGNTNGMNNFSLVLIEEKNTDPRTIHYIHVLKDMADKGPNIAKLFYGKLLLKGPKYDYDRDKEGFHKNPEEGIRYIKMAVDAKVPKSYYTYALCMLKGNGLQKNEKKAMQIIEDIANKENDPAAILKCYRYYRESDQRKALTYMKKAADQGNKDYMYKYGEKLMYGDFSESDIKEGEYYMIKSGKEIPRDVQFKYFKKVNGQYEEIPEKNPNSFDEKQKKADTFFSDDYEMIDNPKNSNQNDEDEAEIEDIEPEPEKELEQEPSSKASTAIKSGPVISKPMSEEEIRLINKKEIIAFLQARKADGIAPKDTDEIEFVNDAFKGDTEAMNYLGRELKEIYPKYSAQFYKCSCERVNVKGMFNHAINLIEGIGIRQNKKVAYELFEKLAEVHKYPDSYYQFAYMNENKIGCQKSRIKAFKYYQLSAEECGNVKAMLKVAEDYEKGIGRHLLKNTNEMVKYLKMAVNANSSNVTANYKLGEYYLEVRNNPQEALKYLREAAANKHPRSNYLLYELYSKFDNGPKLITEQEALNCLNIACKLDDEKAIKAKIKLSQRKSKENYNSSSSMTAPDGTVSGFNDSLNNNNNDDDDDDYDYEPASRKRRVKKEEIQEIEEDQDSVEYIDSDKDFIQQIIGIDPNDCSLAEIINIGDDILAKAKENLAKKQSEIEKESVSKAAILNAQSVALKDFDVEKKKAMRCYSYAMNKGEPLGYFKMGQNTDDNLELALSYFEASKGSISEADVEIRKTLEQIGEFYKNKYIYSKKNGDRKEAETYKNQMLDVANKFMEQKAYVSSAKWFKNAGYNKEFDRCIDLAKQNLDSLDGKQQFMLGQILETKRETIESESTKKSQEKFILDIYKRAVQNDCPEAQESYNRLSKKILDEMSSNADDSKTLNELGLSFLKGLNGAEIDEKKAASFFEKAASNGNIDGIVNYAKCLLFGTGVPQNMHEAFQLFKRASSFSSKFNQLNSPINYLFNEISTDIESSTTSSDESDFDSSPSNLVSAKSSSSSSRFFIDNSKGHESLAEAICYYAFCLMKKVGINDESSEETDNDDKIMKFFKMAAKMGNIEAMVIYGSHCINEQDGPLFLKYAAISGNPEAQFIYSNYLKNKDQNSSRKYLKLAAENRTYSPFFPTDKDEEINIKKAAGYFEPAVEAYGNALYSNIDEETDQAVDYFKKLSDDQNVYGLAMYARCIFDGVINEDSEDDQDGESKYSRILKKAADLGDSGSQYMYAINKMEDEEEQNCSKEVSKYLKLAADQGNVKACCSYAERLEYGKGVDKNLEEAVRYCQQALSIEPSNDFAKNIRDQCLREMK